MTHEKKIAQWIGPGQLGAEVGAGASPVPGLDPRPIYVDCFKSFGAEPNLADFYGHACDLPFHDHSLDYVVASHVLEHVANPVAALAEWYRVVRPGGIIYLVVPHRQCTWDHPRQLTPVAHYQAEFMAAVLSADMDNTEKVVILIEECRDMKLKILPPDINVSRYKFTVNGAGQIVYGLGALKGAG